MLNKFSNTNQEHVKFKITLKNHIFGVKRSIFCRLICNIIMNVIIGVKHVFLCINICWTLKVELKPKARVLTTPVGSSRCKCIRKPCFVVIQGSHRPGKVLEFKKNVFCPGICKIVLENMNYIVLEKYKIP